MRANGPSTYIHDFVTNLYNALVAKGVGSTKIILPESQNWPDYHNLAGPAMSDPNVAADVGIIADHNYDGANGPANLARNNLRQGALGNGGFPALAARTATLPMAFITPSGFSSS